MPDPPLLFSGGCHGPYLLRNIVETTTEGGIIGIGESTNACVTGFEHLAEAFRVKPIDVWLADLHNFGGFAG